VCSSAEYVITPLSLPSLQDFFATSSNVGVLISETGLTISQQLDGWLLYAEHWRWRRVALPTISGSTLEANGTTVSCRAEQGGSDFIC
jgi:hypothetical protein